MCSSFASSDVPACSFDSTTMREPLISLLCNVHAVQIKLNFLKLDAACELKFYSFYSATT